MLLISSGKKKKKITGCKEMDYLKRASCSTDRSWFPFELHQLYSSIAFLTSLVLFPIHGNKRNSIQRKLTTTTEKKGASFCFMMTLLKNIQFNASSCFSWVFCSSDISAAKRKLSEKNEILLLNDMIVILFFSPS